MIWPRFIARFFAWFGGYFWLPCPVCKEPFAGFEASMGGGVVVKEADGEHMYCVCQKPLCVAEGQRQQNDYMQQIGWGTIQPGTVLRIDIPDQYRVSSAAEERQTKEKP